MKKLMVTVGLVVAFVVVSMIANLVLRGLGVEPSWARVVLQSIIAAPVLYPAMRVWESER